MFVPLFALPLTTQLMLTVADGVPKLDVTASCRGAAAASATDAKGTMQNCLDREQKYRDQLVNRWLQFAPADRVKCTKAVAAFEPTYSELLTCLEMAQDLKKGN